MAETLTEAEQAKIASAKKSIRKKLFEFSQEKLDIIKTASGYNGNYHYAPLDEIMPIVEPLLKKHGLWYEHTTYLDENYKTILLTTIFELEGDGERWCSTEINPQAKLAKMNEFMVVGSGLTYFRRYHIETLLGLVTTEDTDAGGKIKDHKANKVEQAGNTSGQDFVKTFVNLIKVGQSKESIDKKYLKYNSKFTSEQDAEIVKMIAEYGA